MDQNFFNKIRILDGGMGQELLARGMEPNGTLWSANALLQEKYHQLLLETHQDFIKAGAEVIVTTTFTTRKSRLRDNSADDEMRENFNSQAKLLNPYIDFFYFDVLSSIREFKIAIESIKEFNKPYLLGAHISEGNHLSQLISPGDPLISERNPWIPEGTLLISKGNHLIS